MDTNRILFHWALSFLCEYTPYGGTKSPIGEQFEDYYFWKITTAEYAALVIAETCF